MAPEKPRQPDIEPFDAANSVRLGGKQWLVALLIVAAVLIVLPIAWERVEMLEAADDYRIPYTLADDYWLFARFCRQARDEGKAFLLGDSVAWGHYVPQDRTLSAELNRLAGAQRLANAGVDGIHPAAMAGLVEHYADGISDSAVVLHCNLLWMSSKRHDLQVTKEFAFNHPRLVPQFHPDIPCYKEPLAPRLRTVVHRYVPVFQWAEHVQIAHFGRRGVSGWTIDHPYENPARQVALRIPSGHAPAVSPGEAVSWQRKRIGPMDAEWVALDESFQWSMFWRTVDALLRKDNRLFIVLGPFNEHMLTDESRLRYGECKAAAAEWFRRRGIAHVVCPPLPSDLYADASHPLAAGYAEWARRLWANEQFRQFLREGGPGS